MQLGLGEEEPTPSGILRRRNRGADEDDAIKNGEDMFGKEPWNSLLKNRVGVQSLKARLGELLNETTRREFPKLGAEISKILNTSQRELDSLGAARQTERQQRLFLSGMVRQFQELAQFMRSLRNGMSSD